MTKLYSKQMDMICEMENANVEIKNEYIVISNNNENKYFNKDGQEVENTEVYKGNIVFAKKENDKWGFVDRNKNMVVTAKYDKVTEFNKYGFAAVEKDGKWGAIDKEGKEIVSTIYKFNENQEPFFIGKFYQVKYGFGEVYYTDNQNV